jgi:hypothetical protein
MTAPAFIYTSEPWAARSFGRPIFAPSFTLERISADHLPQSSPASPLYRPHLEPVGRAQEAVHVLRKNLVHRCPFIAISFAFLGSCFKKFCACVNYLTLGRRKNVRALSASSTRRRGDANARMDGGNRRRGRDWPDLVVRRDVQLGPRGRLGNEFGLDIAAC